LKRLSDDTPFVDVIPSERTPAKERTIAKHPSLKPQSFLRLLASHILPFDEGIVLDPFAGSGSTIAACLAVGVRSVGVEKNVGYYGVAKRAIPQLASLSVGCRMSAEYQTAASAMQSSLAFEHRTEYGA
jgi:site-specific DNA-methyltransferase (adenine-specific)